jgi:uncharacterized coiled-coil DUF342 family protein
VIVADADITTQVLIQIRDEIVATRTELTGEIHTLSEEIVATRTELTGEIQVLTVELRGTKTELKAEIAKTNERLESLEAKVDILNDKVEAIGRYAKNVSRRQDKAIDELRERVAKLEARRKN